MSETIFYIDKSEVREGKLQQLKAAMGHLVAFLDENVPDAISYGIYLNEAEDQMTVIHAHPDSASLEHHMRIGAPEFAKFKDLVKLKSIQVYGRPSAKVRSLLDEKAKMLGDGGVAVFTLQSGFERFQAAA
ncbi:hypothetical protein [Chelativorans salis]|uniref:ABM domain-containing protein n=1 Tax=Chelativorans salis TaxID=2978478 RepID=A0ABT2LH49_9HYPH|nr:hypothetical protein [Chelativorans sp. EGI FJ00035]MCT7373870.1 hypothetical protein [Chelativorans sp. EGI FJ00035]